jgi:hypothetical protein
MGSFSDTKRPRHGVSYNILSKKDIIIREVSEIIFYMILVGGLTAGFARGARRAL